MYGRRGMGTYINWPICGIPGMQAAQTLKYRIQGLGDCGCGCGGSCQTGLGYFDTGWDISGWGWMEWGTVLALAYVVMSTFSTTKRGYKRAAGTIRRTRKRSQARRRERLERELETL